jgi:hypothetical protein
MVLQMLLRGECYENVYTERLTNYPSLNRRFGGTCRLHLQGRKISVMLSQYEAGSKQRNICCQVFHGGFVLALVLALALKMEAIYSTET